MPGLYIHIPFCVQKCAYCDFYSRPSGSGSVSEVIAALKREMTLNANRGSNREFDVPDKFDTIYVGGGTPSLLSPEQLQSLIDEASELWDCTGLREVTVEANPEDLTDDYITRLAATGFNRLSIGIQSFDDELLRLMNRRHSAQRAKDAVKAAQRAGFGNITVDLIYGTPGMTIRQWEQSLDEAIGLGIQHISAYHLTIEPGTVFGRMAQQGKIAPIDDCVSEKQYETLRRKLGDAGFEHYEISNFAKPGCRAIHNSSYWNSEPYLGIGPSAHSYDGRIRRWAVADTESYMQNAGTDTIYESEILSEIDCFNEFVMTSLRQAKGVEIGEMERRFGREMAQRFMKQAALFLENGEMLQSDGRVAITAPNFLLSDYIISRFFALD